MEVPEERPGDRAAAATTPTSEEGAGAAVSEEAQVDEERLLDACDQRTSKVGLELRCDGFIVMFSRLRGTEPATRQVIELVTRDYLRGLEAGGKGELEIHEARATNRDGQVVGLVGWTLGRSGEVRGSGAFIALPSGERDVLTAACMAKGSGGIARCEEVHSELLTVGLPTLEPEPAEP